MKVSRSNFKSGGNADVHSYNTRFATSYHITVHRTSLLHYTIRTEGQLLWNSLDSN